MQLAAVTDARSVAHSPGVRRQPNLKALTSVRFFAALQVALYHLVRPFALWGVFAPVFTSGYVAVSFFFVLSGFILTYSHALEYERGKGSPSKFYIARFARIYPVYLLTTFAAGWVMRAQFVKPIHFFAFIADLFALQTWSIRTANFFNIPAWSISTEAFFYAVFPFLLLRLKPRSRNGALLAMACWWLLALAVPLYCVFRFPEVSWSEFGLAIVTPGSDAVFWTRRLPLLALPEFLMGASLGWLFLNFRPSARTASFCAWFGSLGTLAALELSGHLPFVLLHNGLLLPLFALVILGLSYNNLLSRLLSGNILVLLGEASFSLYLIHFLFDAWITQYMGPEHSIRTAALKLAVLIPLSVLLHLAVERPCRRLILAWWSRRHPSQLVLSGAENRASQS